MKSLLTTFIAFAISLASSAQDNNPLVLNTDAEYFNFWLGKWYLVKEDDSIDTAFYFQVKQSVHAAAFDEIWQFGSGQKSVALRAWDKSNNKWGFVWVSGNGLYQVWDSRKIDGHWYIYKEFTVNNDTYMSRQAFLPQSDGTVLRISEKSYDEKTWELRFKQRLKKMDK
jgi:hypothetical protein